MKLLQINTVAVNGSTGRIAEQIGNFIINKGWESWIAYGRAATKSQSKLIKIGNKFVVSSPTALLNSSFRVLNFPSVV